MLSPQKTFPEDVTVTARALSPIAIDDRQTGKSKCSRHVSDPHCVQACAAPAVYPLVEIDVGTRFIVDGSVVVVNPSFSRILLTPIDPVRNGAGVSAIFVAYHARAVDGMLTL
jgi:hypothetical protein